MNIKDIILELRTLGARFLEHVDNIEISQKHQTSTLVFTVGTTDVYQCICIVVSQDNNETTINSHFQISSHNCLKLLQKTNVIRSISPTAQKYKALLSYSEDEEYPNVFNLVIENEEITLEFIKSWFNVWSKCYAQKWVVTSSKYTTIESIYALLTSSEEERILLCEEPGWRNVLIETLYFFNDKFDRNTLIQAQSELRRLSDVNFRIWNLNSLYSYVRQYSSMDLIRILSAEDSDQEVHVIKEERLLAYNIPAEKFVKDVKHIKEIILDDTNVSSDLSISNNNFFVANRTINYNGTTINFHQLAAPYTKKIQSNLTSEHQRLISISVDYFDDKRYQYDSWDLALSECKNYLLLYYYYEFQMCAWAFLPKNLIKITYE